MSKTKPEEKTKALAKSDNRPLAWGGVMPIPANSQEQAVTVFCNQVAMIYGVPSMGVNAMGTQPYLNKDGRLYLLGEVRKGKSAVKAIRKEFVQLSTKPEEMAVVKVTLVFKDGTEFEAIGEASRANVKLEAVKNTLNMMAETRALNRAIWQAIAGDVWNRVRDNLEKSKLSDEEKAKVVEAGRVSYEEMQGGKKIAGEVPVKSTDEELIATTKEKIDKATDTETLLKYHKNIVISRASQRVKDELVEYIQERGKQLGEN